ncbi:MAG: HD domain-containing protein [SAR324 cluster bacterium]|nr:HD domain-containing protein [SAR324 cluster bacterium]
MKQIDILTPQGNLSDIQKNPNLDVVMNLFKIPRAFTVSGFGDWNVGQHSFCTAFLALYWARFRGYEESKRNELMVMALTHDLHESATGDILPALKNSDLRAQLDEVQQSFLSSLQVEEKSELKVDLKILDVIAFMYEIQRAQTINLEQKASLQSFFLTQKEHLNNYCQSHGFNDVQDFLDQLGVFKSVTLSDPGESH